MSPIKKTGLAHLEQVRSLYSSCKDRWLPVSIPLPYRQPRRNEKSSLPRETMEPPGRSGRSMIRRRTVWREVCIPKRAASLVPPLQQVARPMEVSCWQYRIVIFAQGRTRSGRRSRRDFPLTEWITAEEFPHAQDKLDTATTTMLLSSCYQEQK
jgi:hypothetical protein